MASYERQLSEAHRKIAMLEAALEREQRAASRTRIASQQGLQEESQEAA